jgi:hypothetical protein
MAKRITKMLYIFKSYTKMLRIMYYISSNLNMLYICKIEKGVEEAERDGS